MPTYVPLQSIQLNDISTTVTFSNIPQGYSDLRIVYTYGVTSGNSASYIRFNGDSATNYSNTLLTGNGVSTVSSIRNATQSEIYMLQNIGHGSGQGIGAPTYIDLIGYSNTTTNKTLLSRAFGINNSSTTEIQANVGTWRNTSAINSVTVHAQSSTFTVGSKFDLYAVSTVGANNTQAFGGTDIFYDSSYVYHVFKGSGTFTPNRNLTADILVVAGGGGGGGAVSFGTDGAGGGGAGGLLAFTSQSLTPISYAVTVGAGGSNVVNSDSNGVTGSDSQFGSLTLVKGGGGGGGAGAAGSTGGSGGGSGYNSSGGAATSGQGFAGGTNNNTTNGGGGGSAAAGSAGVTGSDGGNGGNGLTTYSSWGLTTNTGQNVSGTVYYAGGGGGASDASTGNAGTGGFGGGGLGMYRGASPAASGTTNTGGGGGGAGAGSKTSGSGGSGIVIVRYAR